MSGADIRAGGAFIEVFAKSDSLKKGLAEAKKELSNFQLSANRVGSITGALFGRNSGIGGGIKNAFSGVGAALENGFSKATQGSQLFLGSMRAVELKMRNFSVSARNLGLDLIKLGVVLGTPVAIGVKQFADFEQALAKVSTFLAEPTKLMPAFKREILELSEQFGTSATSIAEGLSEILSAGIPASKAMNFVKDSLKGSIGNVVAFKDQMSLLVTVMQAYEGSNLTTAKATEILRVIVEKGRIPADQLALSFGQVVSGAANAGVSFEETAAAMSAMSLTGLTVAEQTTALNGVLNSFSSAAPEAADAFLKLNKALGNSSDPMTIATLRTKGLTKVLEELSALSPDDLGAIFKETRAGRGVTILVAKMKEYKDALAQARSGGDLANTALEKMITTLKHLGDKLIEVGRNLAIQFGEVLLGTLTDLAHALIDIGKIISEFIKKNPELALTLAKVSAAVLAAGGAFVSLGLGFSVLSTVLSGFVAVGTLIVDAVAAISSAMFGLFLFFTSGTGAIVLAIVAIASIFIDFGKIFGSVVSSVKSGFASLSGIFGRFKDGIVETFGLVKRAIAAKDYDLAVRIIVTKIKTIWFEAVEGIKNKYRELKQSLIDNLNAAGRFVASFIEGILDKFGQLTGFSIFGDLKTLFQNTFKDMDGTLEGFAITWKRIWTTMQESAVVVLGVLMRGLANTMQFGQKVFATLQNLTPQGQSYMLFNGGRLLVETSEEGVQGRNKVREKIEELQKDRAVEQERLQSFLDPIDGTVKTNVAQDKLLDSKKRLLEFDRKIAASTTLLGSIQQQNYDKESNAIDAFYNKSITMQNNFILGKEAEIQASERLRESTKMQLQLDKEREDSLQKLNASWGNVDATERTRLRLAKEKTQNKEDLNVAELKKKFEDLSTPLIAATKDLFTKLFADNGDAIVPNNKKDQTKMAELEEQKIRDGIMGAFNVAAIGDFSKGDVMKSIKQLMEEQLALQVEQDKRDKEALEAAKESARNSKIKPSFG